MHSRLHNLLIFKDTFWVQHHLYIDDFKRSGISAAYALHFYQAVKSYREEFSGTGECDVIESKSTTFKVLLDYVFTCNENIENPIKIRQNAMKMGWHYGWVAVPMAKWLNYETRRSCTTANNPKLSVFMEIFTKNKSSWSQGIINDFTWICEFLYKNGL